MSITNIEDVAFNLADVPDPDPLPPRQYIAEVRDFVLSLSRERAVPLLRINYMIPTSEFPPDFDEDNAPEGMVLSNFWIVNCGAPPEPCKLKGGLSQYRKIFEVHGLPTNRQIRPIAREDLGGNWGLTDSDLAELVSQRVKVTTTLDTFEGRRVAKIKFVEPCE